MSAVGFATSSRRSEFNPNEAVRTRSSSSPPPRSPSRSASATCSVFGLALAPPLLPAAAFELLGMSNGSAPIISCPHFGLAGAPAPEALETALETGACMVTPSALSPACMSPSEMAVAH